MVSGTRIFGLDVDGAITAFTTTNGVGKTPLWTRAAPTAGQNFVASATLSGSSTTGVLYAFTADGLMVAINVATGVVAWSTQLPDFTFSNSGVSPVVVGGKVFLQTGDEVTAIDTTTHAVAWEHPLPGNDQYTDVSVSTSTTLVYALEGCDVVALAQTDGHEVWRGRVPKTVQNCAGWSVYLRGDISPVLDSGVVYMNMGYLGLSAFDASTGAVKWRRAPNANITTTTVTEQWVIIASYGDGGGISVLDKTTGDIVDTISSTVVPVNSGVTVAGDLMLFTTQTGRVAAVDLPTMELVWTSSVLGPDAIFSRPTLTGGKIYSYADDYYGANYRIVGLGP